MAKLTFPPFPKSLKNWTPKDRQLNHFGIDPIPWTSSERRIRCPKWDQANQQDDRDGGSLRSSRRGPYVWSSM
ncbi:MAG TPA: hypothetical protein VES67_22175, partial [Vicinamibacterales bacterium]|nr:hypothetical protein [Vicinamibacterales bacterium]